MWEVIKIKAAIKSILRIDPGDTFTCIKIIYLGVQFMLFKRNGGGGVGRQGVVPLGFKSMFIVKHCEFSVCRSILVSITGIFKLGS